MEHHNKDREARSINPPIQAQSAGVQPLSPAWETLMADFMFGDARAGTGAHAGRLLDFRLCQR